MGCSKASPVAFKNVSSRAGASKKFKCQSFSIGCVPRWLQEFQVKKLRKRDPDSRLANHLTVITSVLGGIQDVTCTLWKNSMSEVSTIFSQYWTTLKALPIRWGNIIIRIRRKIQNNYSKTRPIDHVQVKRPNCADCELNNVITQATDIQNNKVNLISHTFVAVFSFKTITANTSVAFSCEAHLTDEVPSRAWVTVTNVLLESILF